MPRPTRQNLPTSANKVGDVWRGSRGKTRASLRGLDDSSEFALGSDLSCRSANRGDIGIVGGLFQVLLTVVNGLPGALIIRAHAWPHVGWLLPVGIGLAGAALARLLVVHFSPEPKAAECSG